MSFLSKIGNMLNSAVDTASNFIKPLKNKVQNGLSKVGNFLDKHHETIGTIASGIGNILMNLPAGQMKDKLQSYGQTINNVGQTFSQNRPSNLARQAISQQMNISHNNQEKVQQQRPQNQQFGTNPVNSPIQQPPFNNRQQTNMNNRQSPSFGNRQSPSFGNRII